MPRFPRRCDTLRSALPLLLAALVAIVISCERREPESRTASSVAASTKAPSTAPAAAPSPSSTVAAAPAPAPTSAPIAAPIAAPPPASTGSTTSASALEPRTSVFRRVGLIGASATAGFGVRAQSRDPASTEMYSADLADVLVASSSEPITISRLGSVFFFSDPINHGRAAVDRMLQFRPTVIFGVDFLFWYGYGTTTLSGRPITRESERLELLEEGLRQADRLTALGVPIVLGDFPDMHDSIGHLLSAEQVPDRETLVKLNARLREWAKAKPNVRLLNLATLVPALDRGERVTLRGREWCAAADGAILQEDRLHPTLVGCMAIASAACELAESCTEDGTCRTLVVEPDRCVDRIIDLQRGGRKQPADAAAPAPGSH